VNQKNNVASLHETNELQLLQKIENTNVMAEFDVAKIVCSVSSFHAGFRHQGRLFLHFER